MAGSYRPYAEAEEASDQNTPITILNNEGESNYSSFKHAPKQLGEYRCFGIPDSRYSARLFPFERTSFTLRNICLGIGNKQSADLILDIPAAGLYNIYIDYYFASYQTGDSEGYC